MIRVVLAALRRVLAGLVLLGLVLPIVSSAPVPVAFGQNAAAETDEADKLADEALAGEAKETVPASAAAPKLGAAAEFPSILELLIKGGWFGLPIGMFSILAVAVSIERALALRRSKIMPPELIEGLGQLAQNPEGFDPRKAYRLCQQYPSTAATVIRAMLLKVGRPHSEVEHAVTQTNEREAARLYTRVRWLNLATAVAPLLGLLGTVWGMVICFFVTANLPIGANKAQYMADGIYIALVTTLEGLCVAIPAASMAHYFEGRILALIREIDDLLFNLLPQVERFEGKLRVSRQQFGDKAKSAPEIEDEVVSRPSATAK